MIYRCERFRFFVHKVLYLALLLILSGDVNPGPLNTQGLELLKTLKSGQATILSKLEAIDTRMAKHKEVMAEINSKLREAEGQTKVLIEQLNEQESTIRTITKEVKQLHDKSVDSENRSRRNNLVFYGFNHSESVTWEQSELLLKNICKESLGLELQSVERVHHIGHYSATKNRPINVNFASHKE